jgi:hypothetical protein
MVASWCAAEGARLKLASPRLQFKIIETWSEP